ncbi:MAG: cation-translocating P-type ATPase [Spirochaetaceae bacterium]|nr:MAG: cation-translocating P-type ATPase [Spirochaetaceae bacterium]
MNGMEETEKRAEPQLIATVHGVPETGSEAPLFSCGCSSCGTAPSSGAPHGAIPAEGSQTAEVASSSTATCNTAPKTARLRAAAPWVRYGAAILLALAAELSHAFPGPVVELSGIPAGFLSAALALLAIAITGLKTYRAGLAAALRRTLNMNALMSIAVTGAIILQYWSEAAMVMVLFSLSERIEQLSLQRADNAVRKLLDIKPETALALQADGSWQTVPVARVALDAMIRVLPGERVPLDGTVIEGSSWVDQSPLTGESVPQEKSAGDRVFAGTLNQDGALQVRVTATAGDTELAHIVRLMEQARRNKSATQRFVDRFATYYTPVVVVAALLTAVVPPLVWGFQWTDWIYRALVLLIIACPCALVISTPITVVSGLTAAARAGILVKGGIHLERAGTITHLVLDKTGTLTQGRPVITDVHLFTRNTADVYQSVALLGAHSTHPLARAAAHFAGQQGRASGPLPEAGPDNGARDVSAVPGKGVQGTVAGARWLLGSARFLEEQGIPMAPASDVLSAAGKQGCAVVCVARDAELVALFSAADPLKPTSSDAVEALHAMGVRLVLMSGDLPQTAALIAKRVGIDEVHGGVLPPDKVARVVALQAQNGRSRALVAMAGDGMNDAPALAQSDLGIAMGAMGTGVAVESASVVLMDDDLRKIPFLIRLSRRTRRILAENIAIALGIKALFFGLTLSGHGSMWMAVFADMGASLLVIALGLRLLRYGFRDRAQFSHHLGWH